MAHRDSDFTHPGERRVGGLWLPVDEDGRVLLVQPSYKNGVYQLVGGGARPNEAPHLAAVREGWEEIGLPMVPDTLLITDWSLENPETGSVEGMNFVFFHALTAKDVERIQLNAGGTSAGEDPELVDYKLLHPSELEAYCAPYIVRRVQESLAALADPELRGYRFEGRRIDVAAAA